ncbi:MAG: acyl-CoA dehydrogenase family protein [Myxococcales bacterium]|nr:acyl-CoA dehydrogenase family protein [Myxococcales bacterium]
MRDKVIRQAMDTGLRTLTRVATSEWVEERGLREPAQRLVQAGARTGVVAAGKLVEAVKKRSPAPKARAPQTPFDLSPTEDQQMILDMLKRVSNDLLLPMAEEGDESCLPPEDVLAVGADLGLATAAIPEALGGGGDRSPMTTALVAEALGRGDMGLALALLAPVGVVNTIVDQGTEEQRNTWLPPFNAETFTPAALALMESAPLSNPALPLTRARKKGSGYVLKGQKSAVPLISTARFFLVAAKLDDTTRLFRVERDAAGVTAEAAPLMGLRSADMGNLSLHEVSVEAGALLGGDKYDHARVLDLCRVALCALGVGQCQAVLDYVKEYVNDREAFGEPISHRQSVAFMVADMAIEIEGMRLLTWRAASRAAAGLDFAEQTYLARLLCAEKAMKVGTDGVQLLGGHGYIKDHPVERWYRHLRAVGVLEGALSA